MAKSEATLLIKIQQVGTRSLSAVKRALGSIAKGAAIAGAAIVGFVGKSISAYAEQERAVNSLNQSLVQQGIYTKELSQKYQDMASALQKTTTFGDEAIIASQGQLQSYLGQIEITDELMKSTLDFATAMKVDLKTAADLVGKTVGSSTNALSRYGISVDSGASKAEKLAQVTSALSEKFGGQSEAAAEGLGVLLQLKNSFGDLMETVGKRFAPLIENVSKRLMTFIEDVNSGKNSLEGLVGVVSFTSKVIATLKLVFQQVGTVIAGVFAGLASTVMNLVQGNFTQAWESAKSIASSATDDLQANARAYAEELELIDQSINEGKAQRDEAEIARQQQTAKRKIAIDKQIIAEKDKLQKAEDKKAAKEAAKKLKLQEDADKARLSNMQSVFGRISTMSQSHNIAMMVAGKAAALANIYISTAQGVMQAWKLGPILGPILAPLVIAAGVSQAATVAGVTLAEGGIVKATPGGVPAIIGEGGKDEAVIPLDDKNSFGNSYVINFTVNGGILGTPEEARQFAIVLDEQLLGLRQNNDSLAFDEGIV